MLGFHRLTPTHTGIYYALVVALVFGGAFVRQVNLLLVLGGLMAGPLLLNAWMARRTLRGLSCQRKLPRQLAAGDTLIVGLSLVNSRQRLGAWAVVVEDEISAVEPSSYGAATKPLRPQVLFPYVASGDHRLATYRGVVPRRGLYRFGPLRVSTQFPFGLVVGRERIEQTNDLVVVPRLGRLAPGWAARRRQAFAGTHRRERRHGPEGDFFGLRAWRHGDSRRWIHWRSSARSPQLMVRELEQPRNRDLAVLLDLWRPAAMSAADRDNVELAVSFAATVAADLCRRGGGTLSLLSTDPRQTPLIGPTSVALLNEALERLALVEPSQGDHTASLVEQALASLEPGTEIVLVSTRPVDLAGPPFAAIMADPRRRIAAGRILCIDTSSEKLAEYFDMETTHGDGPDFRDEAREDTTLAQQSA